MYVAQHRAFYNLGVLLSSYLLPVLCAPQWNIGDRQRQPVPGGLGSAVDYQHFSYLVSSACSACVPKHLKYSDWFNITTSFVTVKSLPALSYFSATFSIVVFFSFFFS